VGFFLLELKKLWIYDLIHLTNAYVLFAQGIMKGNDYNKLRNQKIGGS
jgi:hypothetical protein